MRERKNLDKDSSGGGTAGEVFGLALMNHLLRRAFLEISLALAPRRNLRGATGGTIEERTKETRFEHRQTKTIPGIFSDRPT
ncbi:hypothetical protein HPP92_009993 [Vanilla planifolia]|uniref:Uncharacterized protein n=1 Tax=Vanilla planifolia TaxID=51239 RepID=A0A835R7L1_VANPL|nr:hypothetical protein HPP92_009993 [Vanilla planifolia]